MTIQSIVDEVGKLEDEIVRAEPGDPELAAIAARLRELQTEVTRLQGLQQPLVPDAKQPPSTTQKTLAELAQALNSLAEAVESKR